MPPRMSSRLVGKSKLRVASQRREAPSGHPNEQSNDHTKRPTKRQKTRHTPHPRSTGSDAATPSSSVQPNDAIYREQRSREASCTTNAVLDSVPTEHDDNLTKKTKKVRRVVLRFAGLPLDTVLEICGYLPPMDLLNMSYASKELRSILTADYTATLWKKAYTMNLQPVYFGNVKYPPECPCGVDIRHYTAVLFGRTCLFCSGPEADVVHWGALTRLCKTCAPKQLMAPINRSGDESGRILEICWFTGGARGRLLGPNTLFVSGNHSQFVLRKNFERQTHAWRSCIDSKARAHYKEKQLAKKKANESVIRRLADWASYLILERTASLAVRAQWLEKKLEEEGYAGEDLGKWLRNLKDLPLIQKQLPLNNDGWDLIKVKARSIFESEKQKRRQSIMINTYRKRLSAINDLVKKILKSHPRPWVSPPSSTLAKSEHFSVAIEAIEGNDNLAVIKAKLSTETAPHIPDLLAAWRTEADDYLARILAGETTSAATAGEDASRNSLELATTFFECEFCTDPISYPRILVHQCLRNQRKIPSPDGEDAEDDNETLVDVSDLEPHKVHGVATVTEAGVWHRMSRWSSPTWNEARQFISVDEMAVESAKALIRTCGEDPDTVTAQAMGDRKAWFECKRCSVKPKEDEEKEDEEKEEEKEEGDEKDDEGKEEKEEREGEEDGRPSRKLMNWSMAILHDVSVHPDDISSESWKPVTSPSDLELVAAQEAKFFHKTGGKSYERCRHCDYTAQTKAEATSHLMRRHKIATMTNLQEHFYVKLDAPMKAYSRVIKV
ncbi:hypothetical protein BDN70DRAFT_873013 [Pholiota conissans]|uniref:F-box domain-containing protein n=1 Tax=Pholiota conissans TaxID=109636 RepID=A0A9P5ZCT3_9AGAR|nr:hypothetical protein BDN70DRAFT_873013 [Pholiota conissans]